MPRSVDNNLPCWFSVTKNALHRLIQLFRINTLRISLMKRWNNCSSIASVLRFLISFIPLLIAWPSICFCCGVFAVSFFNSLYWKISSPPPRCVFFSWDMKSLHGTWHIGHDSLSAILTDNSSWLPYFALLWQEMKHLTNHFLLFIVFVERRNVRTCILEFSSSYGSDTFFDSSTFALFQFPYLNS